MPLIGGCEASDPQGGEPPGEAPSEARAGVFGEIPGIVRQVEPSVVTILAAGRGGGGEGSGVIVRRGGLIVTNAHVVEGARTLTVALASGDRAPARLVAADPRVDLALLQIDRDGLPTARFTEDLPTVGELAVAVGNPLGFENTVTAGVVSGINRSIPSGGTTPALVDLLADGDVDETYLGVILSPLTPQIAEQFGIAAQTGAIVLEVEPGSPAAEAGVRPGDVIVGVDGRPVDAIEQVLAALRRSKAGDRLNVTVVRGGQRRELTVTLEER